MALPLTRPSASAKVPADKSDTLSPNGERDGVRGCLGSWEALTSILSCIGALNW